MWEAILILGGLGLVFAAGLGVASRYLTVSVRPGVAKVNETLPNLNCGRCGYPSCTELAEAMVDGKEPLDACLRAPHEVTKRIGAILGQEVGEPMVAVLKCGGGWQQANHPFRYVGAQDCRVAVEGGEKACRYGCIGLSTCARVCPSNAIAIGKDGLPHISRDDCVGCGVCVRYCPRHLIDLVPLGQEVAVACSNPEAGRQVRAVCSVGCIGCGACVRACTYDAITLKERLAVIDYDKCTNCRACAIKCPTHAIALRLLAAESGSEVGSALEKVG